MSLVCAGGGTVWAAEATHRHLLAGSMGWLTGAAFVLMVFLGAGWLLYARAVRVDRLHRQVLGSRATLEAQLIHRAQAAVDLAGCGVLDPASALLLSSAGRDALETEDNLVDDGLDPKARRGGSSSSTDRPRRSLIESDLSRVIRAVLDEQGRRVAREVPLGREAVDRLDKACYRVVLARRFHNTHVAEARRLRKDPLVRLFHLAGTAPMPGTFDIDDETEALTDTPHEQDEV